MDNRIQKVQSSNLFITKNLPGEGEDIPPWYPHRCPEDASYFSSLQGGFALGCPDCSDFFCRAERGISAISDTVSYNQLIIKELAISARLAKKT